MWEDLVSEWRRGCEVSGAAEAVVRDDQKLWALGQLGRSQRARHIAQQRGRATPEEAYRNRG